MSLVTRVKVTRVKDISVGGLNLINKLPPLPSPPYVFGYDTRNKVLSTYVDVYIAGLKRESSLHGLSVTSISLRIPISIVTVRLLYDDDI